MLCFCNSTTLRQPTQVQRPGGGWQGLFVVRMRGWWLYNAFWMSYSGD